MDQRHQYLSNQTASNTDVCWRGGGGEHIQYSHNYVLVIWVCAIVTNPPPPLPPFMAADSHSIYTQLAQFAKIQRLLAIQQTQCFQSVCQAPVLSGLPCTPRPLYWCEQQYAPVTQTPINSMIAVKSTNVYPVADMTTPARCWTMKICCMLQPVRSCSQRQSCSRRKELGGFCYALQGAIGNRL